MDHDASQFKVAPMAFRMMSSPIQFWIFRATRTRLGRGWDRAIHGNTYTLTNLPNTACFLILGTPQDSDFDGLTDAYERLVSKTNPYNADTVATGFPIRTRY